MKMENLDSLGWFIASFCFSALLLAMTAVIVTKYLR